MLQILTTTEANHIADLANVARRARDKGLSLFSERRLGEPEPVRGEHNPSAAIGLEPLPPNHPARAALRNAIAGLPEEARWELQALVRIGRGEYGSKGWGEAVTAASTSAEASVEALVDNPDLHDLVKRGLYDLARG